MAIDIIARGMASNSKENITANEVKSKNNGNFSIICAKEHYYTSSRPVTELYLIADPATNDFFLTKDFKSKTKIFNLKENQKYSFAILNNGDIVAIRNAVGLATNDARNDKLRVNPYCWLASENWSIKHEIDFGDKIKPCGWLMNVGFVNLPDSSSVFCEYTRPTVKTANIWRITGDTINPDSWSVKYSFEVGDSNGLKHIHAVQYDWYAKVLYSTTGDANLGAKCLYSRDNGETWTILKENSQKYFRSLNFMFTEDTVYWATDTTDPYQHFIFKAPRTEDGLVDYDNVTDWIRLGMLGTAEYGYRAATYGIVLLEQLNVIIILDRQDVDDTYNYVQLRAIPLDATKISDIQELATLKTPDGSTKMIGFRTRYTEWFPEGNSIKMGFNFTRQTKLDTQVNYIDLFDNKGEDQGTGENNINNLVFDFYKGVDGKIKFTPHTMY